MLTEKSIVLKYNNLRSLPILAILLYAWTGWSGELSIGAVGAVTIAPYKDYDTIVLPFPFVTYKDDHFFIKGTSLGAYLIKNDTHELSIGGSYLGLEFKPSKTNDAALKQLDKRHSTVMADVSYSYVSKVGLVRAQLAQDVLGESNGTLGNVSLHVPWITESFVIMPGIGVQWASSNHNKHYYGISGREAERSGLKQYKPGNTFSPFLTLEAKVKLSERWDAVAKGRVEYLPDKIKDSPMIGKSYAASIMAGVQYNF